MRKNITFARSFVLGLVALPGLIFAQNYDNTYQFITDYERGAHTALYELSNGEIVEGGSVDHPGIPGQKGVEIGLVDPSTGLITPTPFFYYHGNMDHRIADLTESLADPTWVIVPANVIDPSGIYMVNIFKTDPYSGAVNWNLLFKNQSGDNHHANAITQDFQYNYYVLGHVTFTNGMQSLYLISIDDFGNVNWERYYHSGNPNEMYEGIDLIFDGTDIVITGNYYDPNPAGTVILKIDISNGSVVDGRRLVNLDNTSDFQVKDMEYINGEYVLVGQINHQPLQGFMVSYDNSLNVTIAKTYIDPNGNEIVMTGVEPDAGGGMYMSYDLYWPGAANPIPGMMETDPSGNFLVSMIYGIPGYVGSDGILGVQGLSAYVIKGSTDFGSFPGMPSLSLIGQQIPLAHDPSICNREHKLKDPDVVHKTEDIGIEIVEVKSYDYYDMGVELANGETWDCYGNHIASFRLAAPTGIEESEAAGFTIYPNPSDGQVFIQLDEGQTAAYQLGEVYNMMGETVAVFNVNATTLTVDLSNQAPGVYLLRMKSGNGNVSDTQRIVIR